MQIVTDLVRLNENAPAPFSETIIHNYHTYLEANGVYLQNRVEQKVEAVPVEQVVGIHQMYGDDANWGDCLQGAWLKRINPNLEQLRSNPEYYLNDTCKAGMSFIKIEDKYFIETGKHRTVIAKFLAYFNPSVFEESPLRSIPVTEYFIDHDFITMKANLLEIANSYPQLQFEIRHTTALDNYSFLTISEVDPKGKYESFSRAQYQDVVEGLTRPSVKGKWRSERNWNESSVYSFINYKDCAKAEIQTYLGSYEWWSRGKVN
ncbi:hypothetical protein [Vibrio splendidus]|uniref:hypothetical protein n=1 Tax=Vibrio splendidus TaxID=29497 RepID=UPI003D09F2D0